MSVEGWRYCPDLEIARSGLFILVDVSRQSVKVETILEGHLFMAAISRTLPRSSVHRLLHL